VTILPKAQIKNFSIEQLLNIGWVFAGENHEHRLSKGKAKLIMISRFQQIKELFMGFLF
jgi:hypothetical protein